MPRDIAPFEGQFHTNTEDYRLMWGRSSFKRILFICRPSRQRATDMLKDAWRGMDVKDALVVRRLFIADPKRLTREELAPLLAKTPLGKKLRNISIYRGGNHWEKVYRYLEKLGYRSWSENREETRPNWRRAWIRMTLGWGYVPKWARPGANHHYLLAEMGGWEAFHVKHTGRPKSWCPPCNGGQRS